MTRPGRRALAQRLTIPPPTKDLVTGTVTAIDTAARTLTVSPYAGASAGEALTVPYLAQYAPVVGDTVCMGWVGGAALVCLGSYNPPADLTVPGTATIGGTLTAGGGIQLPPGKYARRGPVARPTLQNGWTAYGGGYEPPGYVELPDGRCALVGLAKPGTTAQDTALFTIPAAMCPTNTHVCIAPTNPGTTAQIKITPAGIVSLWNPTGTLTWVGLNQATWLVAAF